MYLLTLIFNQIAKFTLSQSPFHCVQAAMDTQKPPETISVNMTTGYKFSLTYFIIVNSRILLRHSLS